MDLRSPTPRVHHLLSLLLTWLLLLPVATAEAGDVPMDAEWLALLARSREALAGLSHVPPHVAAFDAGDRARTRVVVVGFTGGREHANSRVSGIVRMRQRIESSVGGDSRVVALTYNNRDWMRAVTDVRRRIGDASASAEGGIPLVMVVGHSWGAGAITKFARELGRSRLDVALAVFVDAFSVRNPRVPGNVRYAVNLYQRTGLFRGFLFRGKSKLVLEDPAATIVLANLRVTPSTTHFGWHWNLVQPLLYRQHHRLGHDLRLHEYLLDLVTVAVAPEHEPADIGADTCVVPDGCAGGPAPGAQALGSHR